MPISVAQIYEIFTLRKFPVLQYVMFVVAKRDTDVLLLATPCNTTESAGRPTADGLQKHSNLTTHFSFAVLELQMLINSRHDLL